MLTKADDWQEIWHFAVANEEFLRKHLELPNGIPSHDTIERVFSIVSTDFIQKFRDRWNEAMSAGEGEKVKKLLAIDGKTQRGNAGKGQKANHIVSAVTENGISIGETLVKDKENEIKAIPELLDALDVKGNMITIDAMGTQTEIAAKIRRKGADYVLALKGNQSGLHDDVRQYFDDSDLLSSCAYERTIEKARGGIEKREYWQTCEIDWLSQKKKWAGLKSIGMTRNTITKNGKETVETRYFISSLGLDAKDFARCVRGHWMVESMHWHLDVTFREDANRTLDAQAAFNLNTMRKLALSVLKLFDAGYKNVSLKSKRYIIGLNPAKYLEKVLAL
jgi:predicted transposase YbfD/YdcC